MSNPQKIRCHVCGKESDLPKGQHIICGALYVDGRIARSCPEHQSTDVREAYLKIRNTMKDHFGNQIKTMPIGEL